MKASDIFSHWELVRAGLLKTIEKFDQGQLTYVPFENSYSVGKIVLHIADAEDGWFQYAVRKEYDEWPSHYTLENYPTLVDIKGVLKDVHRKTMAYLDSLSAADLKRVIQTPWDESIPLDWIIWHVLEHEVHHRGELSLILGLLGEEGLDV